MKTNRKRRTIRSRYGDIETYQEYVCYGYTKHKHTNKPTATIYVFPRIKVGKRNKTIYAKHFREAGYPSVNLNDVHTGKTQWSEIHDWCKQNIKYSWTGNLFWFATEMDKKKFLDWITMTNIVA